MWKLKRVRRHVQSFLVWETGLPRRSRIHFVTITQGFTSSGAKFIPVQDLIVVGTDKVPSVPNNLGILYDEATSSKPTDCR
jgi:hypothetical protein